jgi:hypothetical protein
MVNTLSTSWHLQNLGSWCVEYEKCVSYFSRKTPVKEAALNQAGFVEIPALPSEQILAKTIETGTDGWILCYKRFTDGKLRWPRSEKETRALLGLLCICTLTVS